MNLSAKEKRDLEKLVRAVGGNMSAAARALRTTRAVVIYRVREAKLEALAARLRVESGVSGQRTRARDDDADHRRREEIVAALAAHCTQGKAAAALGIHRRRLQREMERLGVQS